MSPITRQEAAVVTYNYLVKIEFEFATSAATIKDINAVAEFAKTAVTKLVQSGIISGYEDGEFRPNSNITRAESAAVINRVLKKIAEEQGDISGLDPGKKPNQDIKPDHNCADPNCTGEHRAVAREDGVTIIQMDGKIIIVLEDGAVVILDHEEAVTLFKVDGTTVELEIDEDGIFYALPGGWYIQKPCTHNWYCDSIVGLRRNWSCRNCKCWKITTDGYVLLSGTCDRCAKPKIIKLGGWGQGMQ